jgi:hypothetical protein
VNVGGLVASTLDISHAGFLAAKNSCGNERRFGPDTCTRLTVRRSRLRASGDVDGRRRLGLTLIAVRVVLASPVGARGPLSIPRARRVGTIGTVSG